MSPMRENSVVMKRRVEEKSIMECLCADRGWQEALFSHDCLGNILYTCAGMGEADRIFFCCSSPAQSFVC